MVNLVGHHPKASLVIKAPKWVLPMLSLFKPLLDRLNLANNLELSNSLSSSLA